MENKLNIKEYLAQKPDKKLCKDAAELIAHEVANAWEQGDFTVQNADSIAVGQTPAMSKSNCKGHTISFRLHNRTMGADDVGIEHKKFDIDYLQNLLKLNNQPWSLVEKYFYQKLGDYLDLSGIVVFSYYMKKNPLSDYCYVNINDYQAENKKLSDNGEEVIPKAQLGVSRLVAPESYEGSEPTIALNLVISTKKEIKAFLDSQAKTDND